MSIWKLNEGASWKFHSARNLNARVPRNCFENIFLSTCTENIRMGPGWTQTRKLDSWVSPAWPHGNSRGVKMYLRQWYAIYDVLALGLMGRSYPCLLHVHGTYKQVCMCVHLGLYSRVHTHSYKLFSLKLTSSYETTTKNLKVSVKNYAPRGSPSKLADVWTHKPWGFANSKLGVTYFRF